MMEIKNNVLIGIENYLFLYQGSQRQFDYLTGQKTPSIESVSNFSSNIDSRIKYCSENEIAYHHVVFPSKPLLKTAFLPRDYRNKVSSLFNRCYLDLLSESSKKALFYPLDYLQKFEKNTSTFKKYDTHMTDLSNYEVASYLLRILDISIKTIPLNISDEMMSGDLCHMISTKYENKETSLYLENKSIFRTGNRLALPSNTNEVCISHNLGASDKPRLLIFGDSFFKDVLKFLEPFFTDIMYVRSDTFQKDIIELFKPDIIFTGNAERYLSKVSSDEKSTPFLWSLLGSNKYLPSNDYTSAFKANLSFAYHHNHYTSWKSEILKSNKPSLLLEHPEFNSHIEFVESSHYLAFNSLGNDPYLIYKNVDFQPQNQYSICIDLFSSIDTTLQVFFTDSRDKQAQFSEANSIRSFIKKGNNKLDVILKFGYLGSSLRIDPMNQRGSMEIYDIRIKTGKQD